MEMTHVQSSNIAAIGYTPGPGGKPGNLYVDFKGGSRYCYSDVPATTYAALQEAPSKGEFLAKVVKGTYPVHKVEK